MIDTNVFMEKKFQTESIEAKDLLYIVEKEYITFIYNNILLGEYKNNLEKLVTSTKEEFNKFMKDGGLAGVLGLFGGVSKRDSKDILVKKYVNKYLKKFGKYLEALGGVDIGLQGLEKLFENYFKMVPPFEKSKKDEFPDAAIIISLDKWVENTLGDEDIVYVVTKDKGLANGVKELNNSRIKLKEEIYNVIEEYSDEFLDEIFNEFIEEDKGRDENLASIIWQQYDVYSFIDPSDIEIYLDLGITSIDDVEVDLIAEGEYPLEELVFTEKKDDKILVKIRATYEAEFNIDYTYIDYDNSIWDSEEKNYLFLDSREGQLYDITPITFIIELEIQKKAFDMCKHKKSWDFDYFEITNLEKESNTIEFFDNDKDTYY